MYFSTPFASSGDKTTIPEAAQPSGSVSFSQGYPIKYEQDPDTTGLDIERDKMNELFYQITNELKQYQDHGTPDYYSARGDAGAGYSIYDRVRYSNVVYQSLVNSNTAVPGTDPTKWQVDGSFVKGPSSSVDGEIALFDATTGKLIKRATGSGFVKATSGVYSAQASIALSDLGTQGANTVLANATGSSAVPTAVSMANSTVLARSASGNIAAHTLSGLSASGGVLSVAAGNALQAPVQSQTSTYTTLTGNIPYDNTMPQIGEGSEVLTVTITPTSASSRMRLEFGFGWDCVNTGAMFSMALFVDATANALWANGALDGSNAHLESMYQQFEVVAGSTASRTYRLRCGADSGNSYINGDGLGAIYGGAMQAFLRVTEIAA